jgi:hypothetical protein
MYCDCTRGLSNYITSAVIAFSGLQLYSRCVGPIACAVRWVPVYGPWGSPARALGALAERTAPERAVLCALWFPDRDAVLVWCLWSAGSGKSWHAPATLHMSRPDHWAHFSHRRDPKPVLSCAEPTWP